MLIESDGAVFKADAYFWPKQVWSIRKQKWVPYKGEVPKPEGWGDIVTDEQAKEFMGPF